MRLRLKTSILLVLFNFPLAAWAEVGHLDALIYSGPAWSPYIVGAGIGVLSWLTFYFSDKPIGASTFYAMVAGLIGKGIAPSHTQSLEYYKETPPKFNWELIFVLAAVPGAFVSAWHGGEITNEWLNPLWIDRFGEGIGFRGLIGFIGGFLMAFGARLAGGCTSGHGISGTLQLNVASWVAVVAFFLGGILVAFPFYIW